MVSFYAENWFIFRRGHDATFVGDPELRSLINLSDRVILPLLAQLTFVGVIDILHSLENLYRINRNSME